jgi:hypothetical protein
MTVILPKKHIDKLMADLGDFIVKKHKSIEMGITPIPLVSEEEAKQMVKQIFKHLQSKQFQPLGEGVGMKFKVNADRLEEIENNYKHELDVYDDNTTDIWLGDLDYLIKEAKKSREYEEKLNEIERIVDKSPYVYNAIYEIVHGKSVLDKPPMFQVKEKMLDVKLPPSKANKIFDDWND